MAVFRRKSRAKKVFRSRGRKTPMKKRKLSLSVLSQKVSKLTTTIETKSGEKVSKLTTTIETKSYQNVQYQRCPFAGAPQPNRRRTRQQGGIDGIHTHATFSAFKQPHTPTLQHAHPNNDTRSQMAGSEM